MEYEDIIRISAGVFAFAILAILIRRRRDLNK